MGVLLQSDHLDFFVTCQQTTILTEVCSGGTFEAYWMSIKVSPNNPLNKDY